MSQSNNFWKWMFVGLIVVTTLLVAGYAVTKQFQDQQKTFNMALAEEALTTNIEIVELRTQIAALEEGINNLDMQHSSDISRLEQATRDQQNVIDSQQNQIQRIQDQVWDLQNKNYEIEARITSLETQVHSLECEVWGDGCEGPEDPCDGSCGPYYYSCPYCGNRYPYDYPYYNP